jgi:hypothetical protein
MDFTKTDGLVSERRAAQALTYLSWLERHESKILIGLLVGIIFGVWKATR